MTQSLIIIFTKDSDLLLPAITGAIRGSFRKKTLSRTKLKLPTATTIIQETLFLFQDNLSSICNCTIVEVIVPYLYTVTIFQVKDELNLFNKVQSIDVSILNKNNSSISKLILFGELLSALLIMQTLLLF